MLALLWREAVGCGDRIGIADSPSDNRLIGLAELDRRSREGVENRLKVKGRAADDLQHVGGRGLLLERLAQLVEQPRVLDGDDRLSGKTGN
jgi:hypothetical protein